jgi:quercetin dioxygenase-like cupin family protein
MKRIHGLLGVMLVLGVVLASLGSWRVSAQEKDNLKGGKLLQRTELKAAPGWEAILVDRTLPPGAASGKHTQSGNEIVYIQEGAVTLEVEGKAPATIKAGEAFTTSAGQVHNVKNASSTEPAKALAFYVARKGARLEDLSLPAK